MIPRKALLALAVAMVVVTSVAIPVAADASLSITGVSVPGSVTQSDSLNLPVSVSGEEIQSDGVEVSLTLLAGLSCSPSESQSVTLSDGTSSATFDSIAEIEGDDEWHRSGLWPAGCAARVARGRGVPAVLAAVTTLWKM